MADPTLTSKFVILLGDGQESEAFAWPCGAEARSVTLTNATGETVVLDCTDPTGTVAAMKRWVESQDTQVSISGRVSTEAWDTWKDWADDGSEKNIRLVLDEDAADGGGYWSLPAILQQLEIGQTGTSTATFTATIVGAGRRTWTDAS
ncbi:hypothetical protein HKCCE4037_06420 [Rhodobacterales bacterium HKCCE4037]|nr:hypothetical protein [Rhodobacterales bacterium HKCCE4037]